MKFYSGDRPGASHRTCIGNSRRNVGPGVFYEHQRSPDTYFEDGCKSKALPVKAKERAGSIYSGEDADGGEHFGVDSNRSPVVVQNVFLNSKLAGSRPAICLVARKIIAVG